MRLQLVGVDEIAKASKAPERSAADTLSAKIKEIALAILRVLPHLLKGLILTIAITARVVVRGLTSLIGGVVTFNLERVIFGLLGIISAVGTLVAGTLISVVGMISHRCAKSLSTRIQSLANCRGLNSDYCEVKEPNSKRERFISLLERIVGIILVPLEYICKFFLELLSGELENAVSAVVLCVKGLFKLYGMPCEKRDVMRQRVFGYYAGRAIPNFLLEENIDTSKSSFESTPSPAGHSGTQQTEETNPLFTNDSIPVAKAASPLESPKGSSFTREPLPDADHVFQRPVVKSPAVQSKSTTISYQDLLDESPEAFA